VEGKRLLLNVETWWLGTALLGVALAAVPLAKRIARERKRQRREALWVFIFCFDVQNLSPMPSI